MTARDRILDAAATILGEQGVVHATTKEIARVAGCSEALLYKNFGDKQEIFVAVLRERVPGPVDPSELAGRRTVEDNLHTIVLGLLDFYVRTFPMAVSIFGSAELLAAHRASMVRQQAGPHHPVRQVQSYLELERELGRIGAEVDAEATARVITGATFFEAFLAAYEGRATVRARRARASAIVATVLPSLLPR